MKEFVYFAFAGLMTFVEYRRDLNTLRYSTHREISLDERYVIEHYLLYTFAGKTDFYKSAPSIFCYCGIDKRLNQAIEKFRTDGAIGRIDENEINESVSQLIKQSMQSYYFEQIGDTLLAIRRGEPVEKKLDELVKAYNKNAECKIAMGDLLKANDE